MMRKIGLLGVVFAFSVNVANAQDIADIAEELWPQGDKNSGGLDFSAPTGSAASGTFTITTYNVDGFPNSIGGNSNGEFSEIAEILESSALDLVLFQELFTKTKHSRLLDNITTGTYPYRSDHFRGTRTTFGDGLLRMSRFAFDKSSPSFSRVQWDQCAGDLDDYLIDGENPDCLTEKGFTMTRTYIDAELVIDVYNLHGDAGQDAASLAVKALSMAQLADYIDTNSAGNVVVVAGDFNLNWGEGKPAEHRQIIEQFIADTGVTFACVEITGSLDDCSEVYYKPDHITYKGNDVYDIVTLSLDYLDTFVDDDGDDLSDHLPLRALLQWEVKEGDTDTDTSSDADSDIDGDADGDGGADTSADTDTDIGTATGEDTDSNQDDSIDGGADGDTDGTPDSDPDGSPDADTSGEQGGGSEGTEDSEPQSGSCGCRETGSGVTHKVLRALFDVLL